MAKGLASGMPIGLMVARKRLTDQWKRGAHGNTFGGNPICCAAAAATLRVVERDLRANAARVGEYFMTKVRGLMQRYDVIGEVRGRGLMIGMELVEDRAGKRPAAALSEALIRQAFQNGLLLLTCGVSTVRFMPPLVVSDAIVDEGVEILDQSLREVLAQPAARSA
jgi:4-aminobutyrate aminotransferase